MREILATPAARSAGALPVTHRAPVIPLLPAIKSREAIERPRALSRDGPRALLVIPGTPGIAAATRPMIAAETRPPIEAETLPAIAAEIPPATRAETLPAIAEETHPTIPEIEAETPAIRVGILPATGVETPPAIAGA